MFVSTVGRKENQMSLQTIFTFQGAIFPSSRLGRNRLELGPPNLAKPDCLTFSYRASDFVPSTHPHHQRLFIH